MHHVGSGIEPDPSPIETANYHTLHNNWPGIGYHWMIMRDGALFETQGLQTMSYHVAGRNRECVGILINGNFLDGREPTAAQRETLRQLLEWLDQEYPGRQVVKHKDIALPGYGTSCPGEWEL